MKEQFCNNDISLRLKTLGFDEKCFAIYDAYQDNRLVYLCEDGRSPSGIIKTNASMDRPCLAPLWQQVIDWFKEKHSIHISIPNYYDGWRIDIRGFKQNINIEYHSKPGVCLKDYKEAREQSILKAIEILEENE